MATQGHLASEAVLIFAGMRGLKFFFLPFPEIFIDNLWSAEMMWDEQGVSGGHRLYVVTDILGALGGEGVNWW